MLSLSSIQINKTFCRSFAIPLRAVSEYANRSTLILEITIPKSEVSCYMKISFPQEKFPGIFGLVLPYLDKESKSVITDTCSSFYSKSENHMHVIKSLSNYRRQFYVCAGQRYVCVPQAQEQNLDANSYQTAGKMAKAKLW